MLLGMLLGILTYRPIFSEFLKDTDTKTWTQAGASTEQLLPEQHTLPDGSIVEKQTKVVRIADGSSYAVTKQQTFAATDKSIVSETTTINNKHLPKSTYWKFVGLVFLLILYVTMVYGPIAAFLVEMFPTKIRYTSMSLPYHIGNGVFGGLVPFIGLLLTTTFPGNDLVGLWYPIGVATLCLIIGTIYLTNKIDKEVDD
jgi:hypothetical protein